MAPTSVRSIVFGAAGLLLATASISGLAHAQNMGRITGRVTEKESGAPIDAAQIRIDGTTVGAVSAENGTYTINRVAPGTYTLRLIRIGYVSTTQSVTVQAGQAATADFAASRAPYQLEQVVTTATGQQSTRELGNAIATIQASKLVQEQPITRIADVLNGRTAGVTTISSTGSVGGGVRIRVRGLSSASLSNDPLIIVDGVRVEQGSPNICAGFGDTCTGGDRPNFLNNLNPDEIESMEIVKGPSAATLYGTQSANGVVVITTKKGRSGAPRWDVFGAGGFSQNPHDYEKQYYNLGVDKAGRTVDCIAWKEVQGQCTVQQRHVRDLLGDKSTTPFGTGRRQNYGAQVTGGTENVRYFVSGAWENEVGLLKMPDSEVDSLIRIRNTPNVPRWQREPNQLTKTSLRGNFGLPLGSAADLQISSGFITSTTMLPQTGDNLLGVIGTGLFGTANPKATNAWGFAPPRQGLAKSVTRAAKQFVNSSTVNWKPLGWLTTRATMGLDYILWDDAAKIRAGEGCPFCGQAWQGMRGIYKYNNGRYTMDGGATATHGLTSSINSKTAVGVQYNRDARTQVMNQALILPPGGSTIDAGAQKQASEQTTEFVTLGAYLEQQVSWRERLYVTGAIRRDQNSAFGKDFGAAYYPKATVSWIVRDAGAARWLNNLRLRGALGESGQQPDANAATTYLNPVTATVFGVDMPAVTFGRLGNTNLKPERSREIEAGFDLTTLSNRITLQATYYNKKTTDAIVQRNLAPSQTAGTAIFANVGTVSNKGLEVSLNARVLDLRQLRYDAQFEASWNQNRLVSLAPGIQPIVGFGYRHEPGSPLFSAYWPNMKSFKDANGNGVIEPGEVTATSTPVLGGPTNPTRTISMNNTIGLFRDRLRLSGLLDYRGGFTTHDVSHGFACSLGPNNCRAIHDPTAPLEEQARAIIGGAALGAFWSKGDFMRLREVSATYELPRGLSRQLRSSRASLVASGRNLWLWTKEYKGADPESNTQGTDANPYNFVQQAQPRQFLLRVNLSY